MQSPHFGEGLECSRSRGVGRVSVLALRASLAALLLGLSGTAAGQAAGHHRLYPSKPEQRIHSKLFQARLRLVLDRCRNELERSTEAMTDVGRWIKRDHDGLLADWDKLGMIGGDSSGFDPAYSQQRLADPDPALAACVDGNSTSSDYINH